MREHPAVNRRVVGSNPTRGAMLDRQKSCPFTKSEYLCNIRFFSCLFYEYYSVLVKFMQRKKWTKGSKFTAVFSRFLSTYRVQTCDIKKFSLFHKEKSSDFV